jgi:hypothetical protein
LKKHVKKRFLITSVADPHHIDPDPNPAGHFDTDPDPDPACQFDEDRDPTFHFDTVPDPDPNPSF